MSECSYAQGVLNIHRSGYSAVVIVTRVVTRETVAISAQVLCTPYNPVMSLFEATHRMYVYM